MKTVRRMYHIMIIKPAGHRLLVKLKEADKVSKGGIKLFPDSDQERRTLGMQKAYVVEIGFQAFKDFSCGSNWCEVGDLIYMKKYAGEDIVNPETEELYRLINDEDVLAIIKE